MTVAVSCNLSDGVILGVDSAVSLPSQGGGVGKVYENAEKLFQLGDKPVGIAVFGGASIAKRTIGSYLREFEHKDVGGVVSDPSASMEAIAEALRSFFAALYEREVVPLVETELKKPFAEVPLEKRPAFGLVTGGFSGNAYLSEVWSVVIPHHDKPSSAQQNRGPGDFGANWFALFEPIRRYVKGYDPSLIAELEGVFVKSLGRPLNEAESKEAGAILAKYEYQVPFFAMPMKEGVDYTRFSVELVISHHRFVIGAPVVGGRARIGKVSYKEKGFQILDS
jgi:hypothetical protein